MRIKISVIVPVFNNEKYLKKCIDSIIRQTLKEIEIIIIDDGSIDNSGKICDFYETIDSRIKVIHKFNEGVSSARNKGLELARGEYVTFIDSDDYIDQNMLNELYTRAIFEKSDLTICCLKLVMENGEILKENKFGTSKNINYEKLTEDDFYILLKAYSIFQPVCKLFKMEYIKDLKLKYNEDLSFGEDFEFNLRYIKNINKITIIDSSLYSYRNNPNSLTRKFNDNKSKDYVFNKNLLYDFTISRNLLKGNVKTFVINNVLSDYKFFIFQILKSKMKHEKKIYHFNKMTSSRAFNECRKICNTIEINSLMQFCLNHDKFFMWKIYFYIHIIYKIYYVFINKIHKIINYIKIHKTK